MREFILRKITEEDLQTRVDWINNPLVHKTMNIPTPITHNQTLDWYDIVSKNRTRVDLVLDLNNDPVAMSGLIGVDKGTAESYIFTNPFLQNKGIGSIALFLKMVYGFEILKIKKVKSIIDANNVKSKKIFEKFNFKIMKIVKDGIEKDGVKIDRHIYYCNQNNFDFDKLPYSIKNNSVIHVE